MGRSLGRFKISGVLITICTGPFKICIHKILDLGQEVFIFRGTFINRKKGLETRTRFLRASKIMKTRA